MRRSSGWAAGLLLGLVSMAGGVTRSAGQEATGIATVHLADGSAVPLRDWTFSYEYTIRDKAATTFQAASESRAAKELWLEKDVHPVAGNELRLAYKKSSPTVERILLGQAGREQKLTPKPPHRDLIAPNADKGLIVQAQSLDLKGETLTGTKRSFCVVSYTALVVCFSEPSQQVVGVTFD
jgi:hypothetical protein